MQSPLAFLIRHENWKLAYTPSSGSRGVWGTKPVPEEAWGAALKAFDGKPADGYTIEDPCSGSQWYIFDGSIIQGPTTAPLERYTTTWIPPVLTIRN